MASPMDDVTIDPELRSALHRLTVVRDGDEYIVARPDLGVYVAVPPPGAVLIEALRDGESLAAATQQASQAAGGEVDGVDFLTGLREAGLLDTSAAPRSAGAPIGWVERIPRAAVAPLFGRVAWACYCGAALTAVLLLVLRPDLRPIFDDVWFLTDPIWSVLALFFISLLITAMHECWHWLAGRALGVPGRFRVSRRGIFMVFETDLSQLVTLPRRSRYSPLLAGFAFDAVLLAVVLLLRLGFREEILNYPPEIDRFVGALVFRQLVVMIWQVSGVAFRGDSYAILANALGCHNLYRATALTMRHRLRHLTLDEVEELAGMSPRDRSVASWFWLVYIAGGFFMFTVLFKYLVPFAFGMITWVAPNITALEVDTLVFWQSLALVALLVGQFAVIPLIARWERRHSEPAAPPAVSPDSRTVRSRDTRVWQAMVVVLALFATFQAVNNMLIFAASTEATEANRLIDAQDDACLPGQKVTILDFPHVSQQAIVGIVFNSNPPSSGPHYGAAVAPGIYNTYLPPGQSVHALEHGRVVIHYRPEAPEDVVRGLERIAKQFAGDTVLHPNPEIDSQIALSAWGRIDTLEAFDEDRIVTFVDRLRDRYDHQPTAEPDECRAAP